MSIYRGSLEEWEWLDASGEPAVDTWTEAAMASLFTDLRDATAPEGERRGWWGDGTYGSTLWRHLDRGKMTPHLADDVRLSGTQALAWLTPGYAREVEVSAERVGRDRIDLSVYISRQGAPIEILLEV